MRFENKIVVVTGGFRGMGAACVRRLVTEGATVIVLDILDGAPADPVSGVEYRTMDVSSLSSWDDFAGWIEAEHGRIDVLINAAGIAQTRSGFHDLDIDEWSRVIAVNQTGTMLGMRTAIRLMLGQGPLSIVNISSIWGLVAGSGQAAYHASKGAVSLITKNAAVTYAAQHIRVNGVLPGLIETEMVRDQDPAMRAETISNTPMGRVGSVDEVAHGILYLASDEASYVTGVLLPIDGGFTAR